MAQELKAYGMDDPEVGDEYEMYKVSDCGYDRRNDWWSYAFEDEVYLKSEADKVIAELKDKLKHKSEEYANTCRFYENELRHQKYKRCLDNAEICCEKKENCYNRALRKYSKDEADYLVRKSDFWQDWEFRWLKIVEKFKEAK